MRITDNKGKIYEPLREGEKFLLLRECIDSTADYIEICFDEWSAGVGESGYYVIADYEKF